MIVVVFAHLFRFLTSYNNNVADISVLRLLDI